MSSTAVGWVFTHSPLRGTAFAVHLAIADSVNDQNGYEFWMRQNVLAQKARTTRPTVNNCVEMLVADGLLVLVARKRGGANRYRFLMPQRTEVYAVGVSAETTPPKGGDVSTDDGGCNERLQGVSAGLTGGVTNAYTEPKGTQGEPKVEPNSFVLPGFESSQNGSPPAEEDPEFVAFYEDDFPKRVGRKTAYKAWKTARQTTAADVIRAGARRYRVETDGTPKQFIASPAAWLNAGRWDDEPGDNFRSNGKPTGAIGPRGKVAAHTRPEGEVTDL